MKFLACPTLMHVVAGNHDFDFGTLKATTYRVFHVLKKGL